MDTWPTPPAGLPYVAVCAGGDWALGILSNGHIVASAISGSQDLATRAMRVNQDAISRGRRFVAISAGRSHALGLLDNGEAVGWGDDDYGQSSCTAAALSKAGGSRFLAVSVMENASMGLVDNGRIVIWGLTCVRYFRIENNAPIGEGDCMQQTN